MAELGSTRQEVEGVQMIRVRVRLQAVAYSGEEATMHEGGSHDIGAKVDQ